MRTRLTIALASLIGVALAAQANGARAQQASERAPATRSFAPALAPALAGVVQVMIEDCSIKPSAVVGSRRGARRVMRGGDVGEPPRGQGSGSGVIIDAVKGLVLTNAHVVEGAARIRVQLTDGRVVSARVRGSDPSSDIALLEVKAAKLTAVPLADAEGPHVGDLVFAIGYPFGLEQTVTMGVVGGLGRAGMGQAYEDFIQTDAEINEGNSGGALVDGAGRLVGINSAGVFNGPAGVGINYAVPIRMALAVAHQLEAFGEVRRGRLGADYRTLTAAIAHAVRTSHPSGALITAVERGSAAQAAGLQVGDVVIEADGRRTRSETELRAIVGLAEAGRDVPLRVGRKRMMVSLKLRLDEPKAWPEATQAFGATFAAAPKAERGVVVIDVERDTPAARSGLRVGDVVTRLNRTRVADVQSFSNRIDESGRLLALSIKRDGISSLVVIEE